MSGRASWFQLLRELPPRRRSLLSLLLVRHSDPGVVHDQLRAVRLAPHATDQPIRATSTG